MVSKVVVAVCVVLAIAFHQTSAQWWGIQSQNQLRGWGQSGPQSSGFRGFVQQQDGTRYLTCSDTNNNGDDMRVTISLSRNSGTNNNAWGRVWNTGAPSLRLSAHIASGATSSLHGQFRFVVTENARTVEGCSRQALGNILTDRSWWSQSSNVRGIIGSPVHVTRSQITTSSDSIDELRFEDMAGRAIALCPVHQISGSTCMDEIQLCCTMGYDSQPTTASFTTQGQFFPQGPQRFGNNNVMGFGASLGSGQSPNQGTSSGMNTGFVQSPNQGISPGMNSGFGQNSLSSNNAGSSNIGGLPF